MLLAAPFWWDVWGWVIHIYLEAPRHQTKNEKTENFHLVRALKHPTACVTEVWWHTFDTYARRRRGPTFSFARPCSVIGTAVSFPTYPLAVGRSHQVAQGKKLKDRLAKKRSDRESQLVRENADAEAVKVNSFSTCCTV